jgi:hypothetical protein
MSVGVAFPILSGVIALLPAFFSKAAALPRVAIVALLTYKDLLENPLCWI